MPATSLRLLIWAALIAVQSAGCAAQASQTVGPSAPAAVSPASSNAASSSAVVPSQGSATAPALAGLSGRFAFGGANGHIEVVDADGSGVRQLTHAEGTDFDPSWNPDGSALVFRTSRGTYAPDASGTGTEGIFIAEVDPFSERQVFPPAPDVLGGLFPDWSPDGSQIALATVVPDAGERVVIIDARSGTIVRTLPTPGECIEWSPDGKSLSFCAHAHDWDVFAIDADGRNLRSVLSTPGRDYGGLWSPDGRQLLVQTYVGENLADISVVSSAGGPARVLTSGQGIKAPDVWLPDGRIIFELWAPGAALPDWFVMNRDGSDRLPVGQLDAVGAIGPIDWTPH